MTRALLLVVTLAGCRTAGPLPEKVADDCASKGAPNTLSDAAMSCVLEAQRPALMSCLSRESATLHLGLVILPTGETSNLSIVPADQANGPAGRCVLDRARRWRFPEWKGQPRRHDLALKR